MEAFTLHLNWGRSKDLLSLARTYCSDLSSGPGSVQCEYTITNLWQSEGVFTGHEIQFVTKIQTNIILYYRIEFRCKWACHPISLINELNNGPELLVKYRAEFRYV